MCYGRTDNVGQLVDLYSMADVFVNPTLEDNFPTTNLEALACGTPVITYNTGGSPEAIDEKTGVVVEYKNIDQLADKVRWVCETHPFSSEDCRHRAETLFDRNKQFSKYLDLYNNLLGTKPLITPPYEVIRCICDCYTLNDTACSTAERRAA